MAARTVTVTHDVTATNRLQFSNGRVVTTGGAKVVIPNGSSVTGVNAAANRYVAGRLQRHVTNNANIDFYVGTNGAAAPALAYSPVRVRFTGLASAGALIVEPTQGDHPQIASSGIDPAQSVNRWWQITATATSGAPIGAFASYTARFTYLAADLDAGATPALFIAARWDGAAWNGENLTSASTTITNLANLTAFGDYAIGEPGAAIDHWSISHAGSGVACVDQTITITAHDVSHNAVDANSTAVALTTTNAKGTWTGIVAGGGTLVDATPGDGAASYTFAASSTQVQLSFRYADLATTSEVFGFNVSGGGYTESSGSATAADDPPFTMAQAGFQFLNVTDANTTIPTQISGKPSNTGWNAKTIRIQAIRTDTTTGSCAGLFASQSRTVDLGGECNLPTSCAGRLVSVNGSPIATSNDNGGTGAAAYTGVSLSFNASSEADTVLVYPDAGGISVHARYDLDPGVAGYEMVGSSNPFVVRPFGIAFRGANAATPIQHSTTDTGTLLVPAGDNFTMTLVGYQWAAGEDTNDDGFPDLDLADLVNITDNGDTPNFAWDTPAGVATNLPGIAVGTLDRASGGATVTAGEWSAGAATVNDWRYSEVGNGEFFSFTTNYLVAGVSILGLSGYDGTGRAAGHVGRFRPKHFALDGGAPPTLTNRAALTCAPASSFSYMGEGIALTWRLVAQNTQNATTLNYTGAYAKLNPASPTVFNFGARSGTTNLSGRASSVYPGAVPAWANGVLDIPSANSVYAAIERATPDDPDGPYTGTQFGIAPVDSDSVAMNAYDLDVDNNASNDHTALNGTTELRFGRLRLENAVGSQNTALPVQIRSQYWNGSGFATNTSDDCTSIARSAIILDSYVGALAPGGGNCKTFIQQDPVTFAAGVGTLTLAAPTGAATGSVLLTPNLSTTASGNYCDDAASGEDIATAASMPYLQGRWDAADPDTNPNTEYDDNPSARAAFGLYGAQPRNFIYFRENY
jgi:hypothetical protein